MNFLDRLPVATLAKLPKFVKSPMAVYGNARHESAFRLQVMEIGRGAAWLNAGTHESLLQASMFVQARQDHQGMIISCPEEIAWRMGFIDAEQLLRLGSEMKGNGYGQYLLGLVR